MPVSSGDTILASQYNDNRPNTLGVNGTPPTGVLAYISGSGDSVLQIDGSSRAIVRLKDTGAGVDLKIIDIIFDAGNIFFLYRNDDSSIKETPLGINPSGVVTFSDIPVGPASDPTTDNQLTRKAYVFAEDIVNSLIFG